MHNCAMGLIQTMFRFFPFPTRTGLRVLGNPGRDAPVFVTCNYDLTVRRVMGALKGLDCYLLVAKSKGINVWCASVGGILNAYSITSLVKTSGVSERVDHRTLVLPQLSAPGVDIERIREVTGWTCKFGPVYAEDIGEYVVAGFSKTEAMRRARFPLRDRLEMAVMWAVPMSLVAGIVVGLADVRMLPGVLGLIWGLTLLIYAGYGPIMRYLPGSSGLPKALTIGLGGVVLLLAYGLGYEQWPAGRVVGWSLAVLAVTGVLGFDLDGTSPLNAGSTVAYWGRRWPETLKVWGRLGFHFDPFFELAVDPVPCTGCCTCINVCPTGVFRLVVEHGREISRVTDSRRCEQCTACVKQCPVGAILSDPPIRGFDRG